MEIKDYLIDRYNNGNITLDTLVECLLDEHIVEVNEDASMYKFFVEGDEYSGK